ncbi:hypothetical protein [uncultured Helicobacter sp.]|uniref:hypothetical protein n=1 Tax=uncultured Helicobacter sp. TaxID=175537 RepID=UPI002625FE70|nr:hypothetical protein [uncultured Helicobacter sp.]
MIKNNLLFWYNITKSKKWRKKVRVKNILLKYLKSNKLDTLEKLYFDLMFMMVLSFVSFLILSFKFFVYEGF